MYIIVTITLSVLTVLASPSSFAQTDITWPAPPLACTPGRAVQWDDAKKKEPCHCPPKKRICPTTVEQWRTPTLRVAPIELIVQCCLTRAD